MPLHVTVRIYAGGSDTGIAQEGKDILNGKVCHNWLFVLN